MLWYGRWTIYKTKQNREGWNSKDECSSTIKEIICEINNFFTKTVPGKDDFIGEFSPTFKEEITSMLYKALQKENKIWLPHSVLRFNSKFDKAIKRKIAN